MYYGPENILSNFRNAEVCCNTCKQFYAGYEGDGHCRILLQNKERMESSDDTVIVSACVSTCDVCDYWEEIK